MATITVGEAELFYESIGSGPPLVLVHGAWVDHGIWASVVPLLDMHLEVVTYDRRGHGRSTQPSGQGSVADDAADLASLIKQLGMAPALVAGNSFGALIALRVAGTWPELLRGLTAHEPPGLGLLADDPAYTELLAGFSQRVASVVALLELDQLEEAAELFVDTIALGPGGWAQLPSGQRATFVQNALTWLDEMRDPDALGLDLEQLRAYQGPVLLTQGDQSPPMFAPILDLIQGALPQSARQTFAGAGHVPQLTHPQAFADAVLAFADVADIA